MTSDKPQSLLGTCAEEAAHWVFTLYTCESLAPLLPAFRLWLNASPEHHREYLRQEKIWRDLDGLHDQGALDAITVADRKLLDPCGSETHRRVPIERWRAPTARVAACVVPLLITAAIVAIIYPSGRQARPVDTPCDTSVAHQQDACKLATGQHSTDYGQTAALDLVDGSEVDLNANSKVTLELNDHHRHIRLDRGEALFKVNKEHNTPFDVQVGAITVRAVGTVFSVESKGTDSVEAVVQEGKVLIFTASQEPFLVKARQIAEVDGGRVELRPPSQSNVDGRLSWTAGLVSFDGETLEEAAEKFNRYNRRKLVVDPQIAQQPVAGLFRSTSPGEFADALDQLLHIEHRVSWDAQANTEVIYLRPKKSHRTAPEGTGDRNDFATHP